MIDIGIQKMKKYLAHAIQCEQNVFAWEGAIQTANNEMKEVYEQKERANRLQQAALNRLNNLDQIYSDEYKKNKKILKNHRISKIVFFSLLSFDIVVYALAVIIPLIAILPSKLILAMLATVQSTQLIPDTILLILQSIVSMIMVFAPLLFLIAFPIIAIFLITNAVVLIVSGIKTLKSKNKAKYAAIELKKDLKNEKQLEKQSLEEDCKNLSLRLQELNEREIYIGQCQQNIFDTYNDTLVAKNEFYSSGILDEKFQNYIAVSCFYDYIQTGRCTSVNGPYGLASVFTNDEKFRRVLSQLRGISDILQENNDILLDIDRKQSYMCQQAEQARVERERIRQQISENTDAVNNTCIEQRETNRILREWKYQTL